MNPLAFYAVAALILAAAIGATFLKDTRHAAMALMGMLVGMALLFVTLKAGLLAAAQLVVPTLGAAGLLHVAYGRTDEAKASLPTEERRYWAGLVSVLAFVLFFRVIASSDWGTQDFSRLVENGFGVVPWLAAAALGLVGLVGALMFLRKEPA